MSVFEKSASRNFSFKGAIPNQTGIRGKVLSISDPMPVMVYKSNPPVPEYWDKAQTRAKEQVKVELQTELRNPEDQDDDGKRNLYIVVDKKPGGKLAVIQDAVIAGGAKDLAVGGDLALWLIGFDPESDNPDNPRKLFAATYTPPPSGGGAFTQQEPPAQQQPPAQPQYQQPPQQQPPAQQVQAGQQLGQSGNTGAFPPAGPGFQQQPPQQQQFDNGGWLPADQQQQQQPPAGGPQPLFNPGTGEIPPQQPPAQSWPAPQQAAPLAAAAGAAAATTPAVPPVNPDQVKAMIAGGKSDQEIQQVTGAPFDTIQAIRNFARLGLG